jgi:hypothetical protein
MPAGRQEYDKLSGNLGIPSMILDHGGKKDSKNAK